MKFKILHNGCAIAEAEHIESALAIGMRCTYPINEIYIQEEKDGKASTHKLIELLS